MKKMIVGAVLMLLGLLMVLAGLTLSLHATTTNHPNSLGVVISDANPVTSIVGQIVAVNEMEDDERFGVNLRIHPKSTYTLFDVSIAFCRGDLEKLTETHDGVMYYVSGWNAF